MIKITNPIWKAGNSYVITVPSDYINQGMLKIGQEVTVEVVNLG